MQEVNDIYQNPLELCELCTHVCVCVCVYAGCVCVCVCVCAGCVCVCVCAGCVCVCVCVQGVCVCVCAGCVCVCAGCVYVCPYMLMGFWQRLFPNSVGFVRERFEVSAIFFPFNSG